VHLEIDIKKLFIRIKFIYLYENQPDKYHEQLDRKLRKNFENLPMGKNKK